MARRRIEIGSYRGRMTIRDLLILMIKILLVLVVLAGALLVFGEQYLVYGEDGVRLELPFFSREEPAKSQPDLGDISVIIQPDRSEESPPVEELPRGVVAISLDELLAGQAQTLAEQKGAAAVLVDMKTDSGRLNWVSQEAIARNVRASSDRPEVNQAISAALEELTIPAVARVSCFRDGLVGADSGCVLRDKNGNRWSDGTDIPWSAPSNNAVRSYLARCAGELAALGFDQILLDHCGYPTGAVGETVNGAPAADLADRQGNMEKFLAEVDQVLAPYDVVLSICCDGSAAAGTDGLSGLTLTLVEQYGEELWIPNGDSLPQRLAERAVYRVEELDSQRETPQAQLSPVF